MLGRDYLLLRIALTLRLVKGKHSTGVAGVLGGIFPICHQHMLKNRVLQQQPTASVAQSQDVQVPTVQPLKPHQNSSSHLAAISASTLSMPSGI